MKIAKYDPKDFAEHEFYDLPTLPLKETLGIVRKHGITINDLLLTSYITAWTRLHANRNITANNLYCNFSKNMRTYPEPYRFENEFSVATLKFPCGPVSLKTLK